MLKIAICDDDIKFAGKFEEMLISISKQEHIHIDTDVFSDGKELLKDICEEGKNFDLIFMDIEMKDIDGLEAARQIRKTDDLTMLIYVTSHRSYSIAAYDVQPFQFIVKPIDIDMLYQYFMKAYERLTKGPAYFFCQFKNNTDNLMMSNIMYFKSNRRIINIYMSDGATYKFYGKMNDLEERLKQEKADFWRIHQSYLVNVRYIARITNDKVKLKNHKVLYISEDRKKAVGQKYCCYIKENIVE